MIVTAAAGLSIQICIEELSRSSYKHQCGGSSRSYLLYRIMAGPLREEFSRISTRVMREFTMKMPQTQSLRTPRRRLCASLRNRNAHGHVTRAFLRENLQEKCRAQDRDEQFARACTETFYKSHFMRDFTGKVPRPHGLRKPAHLKCTWRGHMPRPRIQVHVLCKPAQSKCTCPSQSTRPDVQLDSS